ncbi:MAG: APC family permease [Planctomycetota bacterium]
MDARPGELRRILGITTGIAVCVGSAVGSGILRTPGEIAAHLPSAEWILIVWTFGACIAALDILILAEWAAMVPRAGGLVAFLHTAFGPGVAFVSGWSILLITWPGSIASVAVAIGEVVSDNSGSLASGMEPSFEARAIAVAVIFILGIVNIVGLHFGARFEIVLTTLKILLLVGLLAAAAFVAPSAVSDAHIAASAAPAAVMPATAWGLLAAAGGALISVIFTFDGYADAVYLSGETKRAEASVPRALFISLVIITALYLFANLAFLSTLGAERMSRSKFVALDMVELSFGAPGKTLLTIVASIVMLGAVNSYLLTGPRIARLLAEEKLAVPAFGKISNTGVPVAATVWLMAVSILFALTNSFSELLGFVVPIISLTTICVAAGLWLERRRHPECPRPFRVRAIGWVVGAQVLLGVVFLVSAILSLAETTPWILAIDTVAVAAGFVIYKFLIKKPAGGS